MASTSKTLSRIPKKVRNPKNPAIYSSEDIYAINDDDDWPALGQSPNDSIAVIPNYTADQGFPEQWESDPNFFDEFIDKDAWEDPVVEMENDNSKEAEAPTVDKSAIVLNGLNASYCLDSINAGHMPPDSTGDSASPFLAENTLCNSGEVPGSIGRGACNPDRTGLTFGHGQHKAEEQQLEKTFATTGSHDTSKTNSSIGTVPNLGLFGECTSSKRDENHMTSSDQQAMADRTSTKRKHVTSCNIFPKRCKHVASSVGSVDTQFLEYKHVASNEGSVEHHERVEKQVTSCNRQSVGETSRESLCQFHKKQPVPYESQTKRYWMEETIDCIKRSQEIQSRLLRLLEEQGQTIGEIVSWMLLLSQC